MKLVLLLLVALGAMRTTAVDRSKMQDKTITKVVKLLQNMLEKSEVEGDEERKIYAKFKCYCDQSEASKTASIDASTKAISLLESKIAELQGSTGELSSKCAELKASMADNQAARDEATSIRNKQNKAFKGERDDLTQAIGQMKSALSTLAAVGADQTASTGADNKQFMAKPSLISLKSDMQSALSAAQAFMNEKQYTQFNSFLQAPFTGTYTSQSGAVLGIIKNMRDTFEQNLENAIENEKNQLASHDEFMKVKKSAHSAMSDLYDESQDELGGNDGELANKRSQLSEEKKSKAEDEEFLESLRPMCEAKAKDYDHRKMMRANEEVAVGEAISILNSDAAFSTFSTVDATSSGAGKGALGFLQVARRHIPTEDVRAVMQRLLRRAAAEEGNKAPRLHHVIAALQAENPFDTVLDEIEKMKEVIVEEGKADKEKLDFCNSERTENHASLKAKNSDILKLEEKIDELTKQINDPVTGLLKQIADTENSLRENDAAQKTETSERTEANTAYQADVKNLVAAEELVSNALRVLNAYYDQIDKAFIQSETGSKEEPAPPSTWENESYSGQSAKGGDAIGMLKFILSETEKEEKEAHADEENEQAAYEDSMTSLKKEQAAKEESLAKLQNDLASTEQDNLDAKEDHKQTSKDRDSVEDYLAKIKPGCDFITSNFELREKNRATETTGLNKAVAALKASPAFKNAVNEATVESYGKCKDQCVENADHVECKACQAAVTIPAYCAGHKGVAGC